MNILSLYNGEIPQDVIKLITTDEIKWAVRKLMKRYRTLSLLGESCKAVDYSKEQLDRKIPPSLRIFPADMMPWKSMMDKHWDGLDDLNEWPVFAKDFARLYFLNEISLKKLSKRFGKSRKYLYNLLDGRKNLIKQNYRYNGLLEYFFIFFVKHGI